MKKIILTVATVFAFTLVNAQEEESDTSITTTTSSPSIKSSKGENYLPEKGDWSVGFGVSGLLNVFNGGTIGNPTYQKSYPLSIVAKKMSSDKTAIRGIANFNFGFNSGSVSNTLETPGVGSVVTENSTSSSNLNITAGLGKEWRRGSTRLQGYYGADVLLKMSPIGSAKNETVVTNKNTAGIVQGTVTTLIENSNGFGFGLEARGFLGAEYFIAPKVAIGAEYSYGLGINYNASGESVTTTTTANTGSPTNVNTVKNATPSSFRASLGGVGVASFNLTLYF